MRSTDGPVESAVIRCPAGHYFCGPIESLTWDRTDKHDPGNAAATSRATRVSVQDGRDGTDGFAIWHPSAGPDPETPRPTTASAYYLGYPARLWITVMHPNHRPAASRYPMEAAVSGGNPARDSR